MAYYYRDNTTLVKNLTPGSLEQGHIDRMHKRFVRDGGEDAKKCQGWGCDSPVKATAHAVTADGRPVKEYFLVRLCTFHSNCKGDSQPYLVHNATKLIAVKTVKNKIVRCG